MSELVFTLVAGGLALFVGRGLFRSGPSSMAPTDGASEAGRSKPVEGRLRRRLLAAGVDLSPGSFVAAAALLAAATSLALLAILPTVPLVGGVGGAFALYAPFGAVQAWGRLRAHHFETRLVEAIDHMVAGLSGGENTVQALASAAAAAEEPVKGELQEVLRRIEIGMPLPRALRRIVRGYDSEGTRIFTQTLLAKLDAGGHLAPVLSSVNRILRERLKLRQQLRSQLSGAQFSAVVIAVMPYVLVPLYLWRKPEWIDRLLEHPLGPQLLLLAFVLQVLGFLWLRRILRTAV